MAAGGVSVSRRAVLTFGDASGRRQSFSVPRAAAAMQPADALAAMLAVAGSGALALAHLDGPLLAKGAKLVSTERRLIVQEVADGS